MKKYFGVVLVLAVIVIYLSGCFYDLVIPESDLNSEDTENGVVPGKGTLKIYLTDTPEKNGDDDDYENIFISISRIEAHFVETYVEQQDAGVVGGSIKGNWQDVVNWSGVEGFKVDLIELEGKSIFLASELLPSGKYTQLRVFLEDQATIVVGGVIYPLDIPSVEQTGIKLNHPFEIIPGQITKLTLDFDAGQSIIKTGNGDYKLKPVIRIISSYSEDLDVSYFGSITGQVDELYDTDGKVGIEDALVEIEGLTLPYGETYDPVTINTDIDGIYDIYDIPIGVYKVTASAGGYIESFQNIIIDSGEVITVDFELEPQP
jgi:hypothetical protein